MSLIYKKVVTLFDDF